MQVTVIASHDVFKYKYLIEIIPKTRYFQVNLIYPKIIPFIISQVHKQLNRNNIINKSLDKQIPCRINFEAFISSQYKSFQLKCSYLVNKPTPPPHFDILHVFAHALKIKYFGRNKRTIFSNSI